MPKLTTNQKLAALANGMENLEDYEESQRAKKDRAATRLRRTSLYGSGARANIPKIQVGTISHAGEVPSSMLFSPFKMNDVAATTGGSSGIPLTTSIPPGAHDMQFGMVTNPTNKSLNDPDRMFFNTSSMKDGLVFVPGGQPPWYFGHNNKTCPPDANFATMAATRYGFRGAKNIRQRHTHPYERANNTKTDYTPKFLADAPEVTDEWVPPIVAATFNSVNGWESPKLWPENCEFATGYPLKRLPSSYRYRRETTVDAEERPKTSSATTMILARSAEREMLRKYDKLESSGEFLSKPLHDKEAFHDHWRVRLNEDATTALSQTFGRFHAPCEAHKLADPTDCISYSGTTAFIVHTKSNEEMVFRHRMEKGLDHAPYDLRWKHIMAHLTRIRANEKRNPDFFNTFIDSLGVHLYSAAMKVGTPTSMKRIELCQALSRFPSFEKCDMRELSTLYGVFDPTKRNCVQFVEMLAAFSVLVNEKEDCEAKLGRLWDLYERYGNDKSQFDKALACLSSVCGSDVDSKTTNEFFKAYFRPSCYRMSILHTKPHALDSDEGAPSPKKIPGLSVQPAYNITESYLNKDSFISTVQQCNFVAQEFDRLLAARLVAMFGKDTRPVGRERELLEKAKNNKFKWMNKKKSA